MTCTCHPDDNPPVPCPGKHAFSECVAAAESHCSTLSSENYPPYALTDQNVRALERAIRAEGFEIMIEVETGKITLEKREEPHNPDECQMCGETIRLGTPCKCFRGDRG